MGFVLGILYFITYYLTPAVVFGPLAQYRIQLIVAVLVILVSIPKLVKSHIFATPQSFALLAMVLAVAMSMVYGAHWPGGAVAKLLAFIPNVFAFFVVFLHFSKKWQLVVLTLILMFVCSFVMIRGALEEKHPMAADSEATTSDVDAASYQLAMRNDNGAWFYRLRGLGEIHDPNDFAQLLVSVIPLTFILWRRKRIVQNIVFVILPASVFLYGIFLTHSRGALLALTAVAFIAARRHIGTWLSVVFGVGLFAAATALQFAGGRDISASAGADRTSLWGQGLDVLKTHPIFGVGIDQLAEYTDVHLTAHNSLVVCAAELGLFGLICWCLFLFPTVRDALAVSSPRQVTDPEAAPSEARPSRFPRTGEETDSLDKDEINRLGRVTLLALVGFLVSAWFLSRAYVLTLFLLGGISESVFQMALRRRMIARRWPFLRFLAYSSGLAVVLVLSMYVLLRIVNRGG